MAIIRRLYIICIWHGSVLVGAFKTEPRQTELFPFVGRGRKASGTGKINGVTFRVPLSYQAPPALGNGYDELTYHAVQPETVKKYGAACLDGTAPGFFYQPAKDPTSYRFVVYLEGGGWCGPSTTHPWGPDVDPATAYSVNFEPCHWRANTSLGSTARGDMGRGDVLLSTEEKVNEDFFGDHHVHVRYCDGSSWTSSRPEPVKLGGVLTFHRGRANLMAVFHDLIHDFGMSQINELVVTGKSAGGLGVLLNIDFLSQEFLPSFGLSPRVVGVPDGAFFLDSENMHTQQTWGVTVRQADEVWKSTELYSTNKACLANHSKEESWKCLMAPYVVPYIQTPLFVMNSAVDGWALREIVGVTCLPGLSGNKPRPMVAGSPIPPGSSLDGLLCSADKSEKGAEAVDRYLKEFNTAFEVVRRNGNGYFIDHCLSHCHGGETWWKTKAEPLKLSTGRAFLNWYFNRSDVTESCVFDTLSWNRNTRINPTCSTVS